MAEQVAARADRYGESRQFFVLGDPSHKHIKFGSKALH